MVSIITIGETDLHDPSEFSVLQSDLDSSDSSRNEEGVLQRDRVRQGLYKIELAWRNITDTEAANLMTAIEPSSVSVTFPTPSGDKTCNMYVGDRNFQASKLFESADQRWNASFNLIEY